MGVIGREEPHTQLIFQERVNPVERSARTAPRDLDAVIVNHDPESFLAKFFGLLSRRLANEDPRLSRPLAVTISIRAPVACAERSRNSSAACRSAGAASAAITIGQVVICPMVRSANAGPADSINVTINPLARTLKLHRRTRLKGRKPCMRLLLPND